VLAEVYDEVPAQAQPAIESVMSKMMMRHQKRVQGLEQQGANVPQSLEMPEGIQDRLEESVNQQEGLQEQESTQEQQQGQQTQGSAGGTTSPGSGGSDGLHRGQ
jgi:hypothetical protein